MPKSRDEIKHERQHGLPWLSPHFGDGGWHSTPGCIGFDPMTIQPMNDRILVLIDSEAEQDGAVIKPDIALNQERESRKGTVLKVGPGKRLDVKTPGINRYKTGERIPMTLKPGDRVIVGPYSDWEAWDADWEGRGRNVAIFLEGDVRLIIES